MTLRAIIFDVDGTIADTESLHLRAFNRAFAQAGLDWHWDDAAYDDLLVVEGGLARIRVWVEAHRPRDLAWAENEGVLTALHAAKSEIYLRALENEGLPLRPGIRRLIHEARSQGIALGVCTTSSRQNFEALILNAMGFEALEWFGTVITGEDVTAHKPDPQGYAAACARLGVAPQDAAAIEDNPRGLAAARAAGLAVIACPGRGTRAADLDGAAIVLSDLGDPGQPFDVLRGDPGRFGHVTLDALRDWTACPAVR
jgi:HAD superfamily hydrolase (TIGR01509 family)